MFTTREVRQERPATGSDQNFGRSVTLTIDDDGVGIGDAGTAFDQRGAGIVEQIAIDAVQTRDLGGLPIAQGRPVKARCVAQIPTEASAVLEGIMIVGSIGVELLGHATDIDTGTAEVAVFCHGNAGAGRSGGPGSANAAGAGTNDEQVEVKLACRRLMGLIGHGNLLDELATWYQDSRGLGSPVSLGTVTRVSAFRLTLWPLTR